MSGGEDLVSSDKVYIGLIPMDQLQSTSPLLCNISVPKSSVINFCRHTRLPQQTTMVKVEIVEEKDSSASPYASSSSSRHSSTESLSSVDSEPSVDESFFDRVVALKDMVPPTTRHHIFTTFAHTASYVKRGSKIIGNIVWVVTTSALLVALPLSLILEDENKVMAQEKEMLEQQQGAQQVCFGPRVFFLTTHTSFFRCLLHLCILPIPVPAPRVNKKP
jgi:mitochondrial import receptor subunit TOM22